MRRSSNPKEFLTQAESALVEAAIEQAETRTSAEIKLVIVRYCWDDIRYKAAKIFRKFGLDKTQQRACVLILLVVTNHEFLIYGDRGIHEKVGQDFWDDVRNMMAAQFKQNEFGQGLCRGINLIGEKLVAHFPSRLDDRNEISNEIDYEQ
ncbi:MAG: TPM domain-containing protein [Planctomycetota bacterium]|jgi:uncharacterized membrane protein